MDLKELWDGKSRILLLIIGFLCILIIFLVISIIYLKLIINKNDIKIDKLEEKLNVYIDKENLIKFKKAKEKEKLLLMRKQEEEIYSLDLLSDNSITKFVSAKVAFNNKKYIPDNLESISGKYLIDLKGGNLKIRKEANIALNKMSEDFYKKFNKKISIVSAYRSYNYQKGIKNRGCSDKYCAKAGYSEHQSGLAIDLWEATSVKIFLSKVNLKKYFEWLKLNAHKYGFHNTYQKGIEIDTYVIEPWHWRYMGVQLATYLYENNMTIAEFYNQKK